MSRQVGRGFEIANQSVYGFESLLAGVFVGRELGRRKITIIDGVDEMIEDLGQGPLGYAHELSELLMLEARESFGDIARSGARSIPELIAKLEVGADFRFR